MYNMHVCACMHACMCGFFVYFQKSATKEVQTKGKLEKALEENKSLRSVQFYFSCLLEININQIHLPLKKMKTKNVCIVSFCPIKKNVIINICGMPHATVSLIRPLPLANSIVAT